MISLQDKISIFNEVFWSKNGIDNFILNLIFIFKFGGLDGNLENPLNYLYYQFKGFESLSMTF
jgi:hypothetical protein